MELWKKILLTIFSISLVIVIIVVIFALASKCKADNSQSSICKALEGAQNFFDDLMKGIEWAFIAAIAGVILGALFGAARWLFSLIKGEGDVTKTPDLNESEVGKQQEKIENGETGEDTDEFDANDGIELQQFGRDV
jgi:hypothetical protein